MFNPPKLPLYTSDFAELVKTVYNDGYQAGFHQGIAACESFLYLLRGEDKGISAAKRRWWVTTLENRIADERKRAEGHAPVTTTGGTECSSTTEST
jgi:hypothetical protein